MARRRRLRTEGGLSEKSQINLFLALVPLMKVCTLANCSCSPLLLLLIPITLTLKSKLQTSAPQVNKFLIVDSEVQCDCHSRTHSGTTSPSPKEFRSSRDRGGSLLPAQSKDPIIATCQRAICVAASFLRRAYNLSSKLREDRQ